MKYYVIYDITPAEDGDDKRMVCIRDTREDAQTVLKALEETNVNFSYYKIEIVNRKF